ncbi:hypothetical protein Nitsa_1458 [Nitratifractor salsuginis DSM 16511]|uniref:Uncharacterized protein n=2 Tax=Nitratifractor salsuginis TaxID=269261 RepID=E6WZR6_NITSE|nr:hypothetical protein Nitsa_1458 [Nitratifractor salsuginis DSM 16511]
MEKEVGKKEEEVAEATENPEKGTEEAASEAVSKEAETPAPEKVEAGAEEQSGANSDSEEKAVESENFEPAGCEVIIPPAEGDRHTRAQKQVEAARSLVENADSEIETCLENIRRDLEAFEQYEETALKPVVDESRRLLAEVGVEGLPPLPEATAVDLEAPDKERLEIRDLSSGKGMAFFWGLVVTLAALAGWWVYGAQKAGLPILPTKVPGLEILEKISGAISLLLGPAENAPVGAAIAIVSSLVLGGLVYWILLSMRAVKNEKVAQEIAQEAGFYCRKKEECKEKMAQVREHLKELKRTVQKYQVLLDEKNAALRRAIFIEQADSLEKLHAKSRQTVEEIRELLQQLERTLGTPMAREGMLTAESVEALRQAKRVVNDHILHLYN